MKLTPKEKERLEIFTAAQMARRRRTRGQLLNVPDVIALICDEIAEAAWDGAPMADVVAVGKHVVTEDEVMPGVRGLVRRIELDCLFPSGTSLVVVNDPVGARSSEGADAIDIGTAPGAITPGAVPIILNASRRTVEIEVTNRGDRTVFISSHYPFSQVNRALAFARDESVGMRLDIPAGSSLAFPPGERLKVRLVDIAGTHLESRFQMSGHVAGGRNADADG